MEEREKILSLLSCFLTSETHEDEALSKRKLDASELLQTATACAQALSCSKVDDKVRFQALSKFLEGLGGNIMMGKLHKPFWVEQAVQVQVNNEESHESPKKKFTERRSHEGQEQILSFLNKAIAHGALVLKDMDLVLHCVRDSSMEHGCMKKMSYDIVRNMDASNKVSSTVLEGMFECFKILSHTRMEEEERMMLLGKLFVVIGNLRKDSLEKSTSEGEDANPYMGNNSNKEVLYGNPAELLQAVMLCAQALSSSRVDDKVRFHTLSNVLEGLGGDFMKRKRHNPTVLEQADFVQEGQPRSTELKEQSHENSKLLLTEGVVQDDHEKILSFLKKAIEKGTLELMDVDSIFSCLHYPNMYPWRGRESKQHEDGHAQSRVSSGLLQQVEIQGETKHSSCSKEREEDLCPRDNELPVNTQNGLPHVTMTSPKGTLPFVSGNQGGESQHGLHVNHDKAEDKDKDVSHTQPQAKVGNSCSDVPSSKSNSPFSDMEVQCEVPHVISYNTSLSLLEEANFNSNKPHCTVDDQVLERDKGTHVHATPKPLTYLEAAKINLNCSSDSSLQEKENHGKLSQTLSFSPNGSHIFKIEQQVLQNRMEMCRFSALGKITLAKGDEPWTWVKLKDKLDDLWGLKSQWRLISLGKGFFHIILTNQEEHDRVWSKEVLHLKPGVLRLQRWSLGFNPSSEKSTKAQVWFRIHHLPWCLWDASIISGIAKRIGDPLRIDKMTLEGSFGHYARVLIEVDISKQIISSVLVDSNNHVFEVQFCPENIPLFCRGCNSIGHSVDDCRLLLRGGKNIRSSHEAPKRSVQQYEWRKKKVHVIDNDKIHKSETSGQKEANLIVESVTDFSAQVGSPSSKDKRADSLIISNQFAILEMEEVADDKTGMSPTGKIFDCKRDIQALDVIPQPLEHSALDEIRVTPCKIAPPMENSNRFSALKENYVADDFESSLPYVSGNDQGENNVHLSDDEEVIIPKLPDRWSDILDEEDYSLQEMNSSIMKARADFYSPYRDIQNFREKLKEVWIDMDDSRFDRDRHVEIEPSWNADIVPKPFVARIPKKDKKVKIGFRQPKGRTSSPKE